MIYKLFAHFKTIKDDPFKFILWVLTSIFLSLSSFWIPLLLGFIIEKNFYDQIMLNNPFIIFSIIFISNSLLVSINQKGAGTNNFAVTLRGATIIVSIMFLIFLSSIIPLKLVGDITLKPFAQYVLLAIALFIGIYVYGFRETIWESTVDDVVEKQENEVEFINTELDTTNEDPINKNVKL